MPLLLAAFSPFAVFGLERANVDLLLFVMVAAAVPCLERGAAWRLLGYGLIVAAGLLKFYPWVLLVLLLRERPLVFLLGAAAFAAMLAALVAGYPVELAESIANLPQVNPFLDAFGASQLPDGLVIVTHMRHAAMFMGDWIDAAIGWGGRLGLLAAALAGAVLLARSGALVRALRRLGGREAQCLSVGAVMMCGCFFTGANLGYRAVFVLFALPGLLALARAADASWLARGMRAAVAAFVLVLWCLPVQRVIDDRVRPVLGDRRGRREARGQPAAEPRVLAAARGAVVGRDDGAAGNRAAHGARQPHLAGRAALGERPGPSGAGDARHHRERDARRRQRRLLRGAAGVAGVEPHHPAAAAGERDQPRRDRFADVRRDALGVAAGEFEHGFADAIVVHDHVRLAEQPLGAQRQQVGGTRPGADQEHHAVGGGLAGEGGGELGARLVLPAGEQQFRGAAGEQLLQGAPPGGEIGQASAEFGPEFIGERGQAAERRRHRGLDARADEPRQHRRRAAGSDRDRERVAIDDGGHDERAELRPVDDVHRHPCRLCGGRERP